MDNATAREILEAYRPEDAGDPVFAEALHVVREDPELAAWFAQQQRLDAALGAALREIPVSPGVRSSILLARAQPVSRAVHWPWAALAAALVGAALLAWPLLAPAPPGKAIALHAISYTSQLPPLQFVCFDAAAVAGWVNRQPGAREAGVVLPNLGKSADMGLIGSSVVQWNGRPAVMLCLQNGQQMAMLYLLGPADSQALAEGSSASFEKDGWLARATKQNGQVRVLATRKTATPAAFPEPF